MAGFFGDLLEFGEDVLTLDFAGAAESGADVLGHIPIIGEGLEEGVDAFFGTTQADAQKEIAKLKQQQADMQADRQRRALVRQARVQQSQVRAAQAVQGESSASNLASANIAGDFASENVFIDETQRLGKAVGDQSAIIGEANQVAGNISAGISIAGAIAGMPSAPKGAPASTGGLDAPAYTGPTAIAPAGTPSTFQSGQVNLGTFNYGSPTQGFTSSNNSGVIKI